MFMTMINTDINLTAAAHDYDIDTCRYDADDDAYVVVHSNYYQFDRFLSEMFGNHHEIEYLCLKPN